MIRAQMKWPEAEPLHNYKPKYKAEGVDYPFSQRGGQRKSKIIYDTNNMKTGCAFVRFRKLVND
jgi:hypothetical protein